MSGHYCLYCCTRWNKGKCSNECTHKEGIICGKQKEGFKLKFSKDELLNGYEWEGFLGGSYHNTYALAEVCKNNTINRLKRIGYFNPFVEIIKVKCFNGDICFKVRYKNDTL